MGVVESVTTRRCFQTDLETWHEQYHQGSNIAKRTQKMVARIRLGLNLSKFAFLLPDQGARGTYLKGHRQFSHVIDPHGSIYRK